MIFEVFNGLNSDIILLIILIEILVIFILGDIRFLNLFIEGNRIFGFFIELDYRLKEIFKGVWKFSYSVGLVVYES